jgi:hypothetical protein
MKRRVFVSSSLGAAMAPALGQAGASKEGTAEGAAAGQKPQLLELRRYRFRFGPMEARHAEYAKGVLVPALNRAGIKPVGAFTPSIGPDSPSVYLLLPHPDAASAVTLVARLRADEEYRKGYETFRSLPATDPPYVRRESTLMVAFDSVPSIAAPTGPQAAPSRTFELRTYESHNEAANAKKIEMFEAGGEIGIFRRVGLTPVFFARDLIGPTLPSLTYMVVFADMAAREKAWGTFGGDPEWVKLRSAPGFSNAEILTNIRISLLRPTDYSQI